MARQAALLFNTKYPSDITEDFRQAFIRDFEEFDLKQRLQRNTETAALFSEDEVEQLNSAIETVVDKLGISGDLATIDTLLRLRSLRVARVLSAVYLPEEPNPGEA